MSNRIWSIVSIALVLALLAGGWFLGAQPLVAAAATADAERASVEQQNVIHQATIAQLSEESKNLAAIEAEYSALRKSIPGSTDSSAFIKGLDALAANAGVQITAITVAEPTAYTLPASAVVAPPTEAETEGATPEATPTAAPAPVAPVGSVATTSPLITPDNFVGVQIGVSVKGDYDSVLTFMNGLQTGTRLFLVTNFTSTRDLDSDGNSVTASIEGFIYVIKQAG